MADVASIHLVLSERTTGLIGAAELAQMKPDASLVNTSRAPIIDRDALLAAMREGRLANAAIDVFDEEPLPADRALRDARAHALARRSDRGAAQSAADRDDRDA